MRSLILTFVLGVLSACAAHGPIEENVSVELPFQEVTQRVGNDTISLFETGTGRPTVVMMHGIPVNSYLWRNVAPIVAEEARVMAFDLPGYGNSSVPSNGDNTYPSLYNITEDFLNARPEDKFILVVADLGSVLGLDYAMQNQDRIAGIVVLEGVFMPAEEWYDQLLPIQKVGFTLMRNDWLARNVIFERPIVQRTTINQLTIRDLSDEEIGRYMAPYEDPAYRRVVLEGPGPADNPPGLVSQNPNDIAAVINRNAAAIRET